MVKSPYVEAYLSELVKLGKKHGFYLAHVDTYGKFLVESRDNPCIKDLDYDEWLLEAELSQPYTEG